MRTASVSMNDRREAVTAEAMADFGLDQDAADDFVADELLAR